jgi:hypothetical protein
MKVKQVYGETKNMVYHQMKKSGKRKYKRNTKEKWGEGRGTAL